jgi:hypothetical protein
MRGHRSVEVRSLSQQTNKQKHNTTQHGRRHRETAPSPGTHERFNHGGGKEKYDERGRTIQRLDGSAFCPVDELFSPRWDTYTDFATLCRNWEEIVVDRNQEEENDNQNENFNKVFHVYDKTRRAVMAVGTRVSTITNDRQKFEACLIVLT